MRYRVAVAVALCAALAVAVPALAQTSDELTTLKREIDALKAGQAAMQNELQAIRRLLEGRPAPSPNAAAAPAPENIEVTVGGAFAKGRPDAQVTIVEFSDFQCPFCGRYVRQTFAQIDREYVETGKLRYVVRNLPLEQLHPDAFRAAEAAECAGAQGKYWEMHERLFAHQDALGADELTQHAAAVGVDMPAFRQCLDSGARAERIRQDMADAQAAGITGTPTFLFALTETNAPTVKVIGRIVGAHPYASFKAALDGLLSAAGPAK
jgi:protein-disulfide isomerase